MDPGDDLARAHKLAHIAKRFGDATDRRGYPVVDIDGRDDALTVEPGQGEISTGSSIRPWWRKNVEGALVGPTDAVAIGGGAKAEFAANGDLAHLFGLFGQQAGAHVAGVDHDEGRAEEQRCFPKAAGSGFGSGAWWKDIVRKISIGAPAEWISMTTSARASTSVVMKWAMRLVIVNRDGSPGKARFMFMPSSEEWRWAAWKAGTLKTGMTIRRPATRRAGSNSCDQILVPDRSFVFVAVGAADRDNRLAGLATNHHIER